jgi:putative transposase
VLDNRHFWTAIRYVERNPVRAGIVAKAEDYEWSSAPAHCKRIWDPLLDPEWLYSDEIYNWKEWLDDPEDSDYLREIRSKTSSGRPCGSEVFVRNVEIGTGRQLRAKERRPKP